MTKKIMITCDICNADITNASKLELIWDSVFSEIKNSKHFCGLEHFRQHVNYISGYRKEEKDEDGYM